VPSGGRVFYLEEFQSCYSQDDNLLTMLVVLPVRKVGCDNLREY